MNREGAKDAKKNSFFESGRSIRKRLLPFQVSKLIDHSKNKGVIVISIQLRLVDSESTIRIRYRNYIQIAYYIGKRYLGHIQKQFGVGWGTLAGL